MSLLASFVFFFSSLTLIVNHFFFLSDIIYNASEVIACIYKIADRISINFFASFLWTFCVDFFLNSSILWNIWINIWKELAMLTITSNNLISQIIYLVIFGKHLMNNTHISPILFILCNSKVGHCLIITSLLNLSRTNVSVNKSNNQLIYIKIIRFVMFD